MAKITAKSCVFSSISCENKYRKSQILPISPGGSPDRSVDCSCLKSDFGGLRISVDTNDGPWAPKKRNFQPFVVKMGLSIGKAQKWWEKGLQPNMKEITSAQDLVDSLHNAGDKLVVVDFFSPGCGGCKALHPKICQIAEQNPDVQFLQVNYEEHKSMCYSLNVHVLPFFRFYRGAEGRVCSFSCTNSTIKKFKDALTKYGPNRCTIGPPKGLEEKELLALAANKDLSFTYTPKPAEAEPTPQPVAQGVHGEAEAAAESSNPKVSYSAAAQRSTQDNAEKSLVTAGSQF